MEIDRIKRIIAESNDLSKLGKDRQALKLLDDAIANAVRENQAGWVTLLTRHASVITDHIGDFNLAKQYLAQGRSQ